MDRIPILLKMHQGYGLGDNVAFSIVLKHLAKYRPNWCIDFITDRGKHKAAVGLCNRVWHYDQPEALPHYAKEIKVTLYENCGNWTDRPNTLAIACLHEKFGLPYDTSLGRYACHVSEEASNLAKSWLASVRIGRTASGRFGAIVIHPHGRSVPSLKDLTSMQTKEICEFIHWIGVAPIVLDWDGKFSPGELERMGAISPSDCPQLWGGDAETNAAIISQCEAFIGVDSGPGKIASATDTPSLIVWTGHHPINYHDPAPNTTHLVPESHRSMVTFSTNYFERTYSYRTYGDGDELTGEVQRWLSDICR